MNPLNEILVEICSDGVTAKSLNPLGEKPIESPYKTEYGRVLGWEKHYSYAVKFEAWQAAEAERETFEIEGKNSEEFESYNDFQDYLEKIKPHTIHKAIKLTGNKIKIIN